MGKTISGRFALLPDEARAGGLSEVRRGVDITSPSGDQVAVKLLKQREDDAITRIFLERETSALGALEHPHIVRLLDSGWDGELERYYIVLEWVDRSLKDEMADGRPLDWLSPTSRPRSETSGRSPSTSSAGPSTAVRSSSAPTTGWCCG
ncbi:protein kinase [Streptomyces sp. CC224B]|uniref:protein kinase n=1 Tax=Streptomyces sp. CC224B TaxID=3044571 RepID=UPI0024A969CA|nr:protein kinase [Streptomyces sp. CC224B]